MRIDATDGHEPDASMSDAAARLPPDRAAHHAWVVSLTRLPDGGIAADLGCGRGEDLRLLAARFRDRSVRLIGVDLSDASEAAVTAAAARDRRISFRRSNLGTSLPFEDASLDLVLSHNMLECLTEPGELAAEVARVLRPGGQAVFAHWDWDSQLYDATDKHLVRRLVAAYADWQQDWMEHADGWMGRRLWRTFSATLRFEGRVEARVLINTSYESPWFGYQNATAFGGLVRRGVVTAEDYERFVQEQIERQASGTYFYAITGFAFVGFRLAA